MLYQVLIDDLIPFFTIGALLLSAVYHSNLYYFNRTHFLRHYSFYLWTCLGFVIIASTALDGRVVRTPHWANIICTILFWSSLNLYFNFILSSIPKKAIKKGLAYTFASRFWIAWPVYIMVQFSVFVFPPNLLFITTILRSVFMVCIYAISFYIIYFLYRQKRDYSNQYLLVGACCMAFFNIGTAITYFSNGYFLSLTALSYICLAYFSELIFFSIAISNKMKIESRNHYKTLDKLNKQALILAEERKKASEALLTYDFKINTERANAAIEQRNAIGNKLHNEFSGSLMALRYLVHDYKEMASSESGKKKFVEIEKEIENIYNDTTNYSHQLSLSSEMVESEFSYNILEYLHKIEKQFSEMSLMSVHTYFNDDEIITKLSGKQTQHLYFWLKECFANTIKHSDAKKVWIGIDFIGNSCVFHFKDNGVKSKHHDLSDGIGVINMRNSAKELNGTCNIVNNKTGYKVVITFPIDGKNQVTTKFKTQDLRLET